jgi:hypothetical protein
MNPFALWAYKLRVYPEEFILPLGALIAAIFCWRKFRARHAVLPFLIYAIMFIAVTMVITAPYTYYHGSLLMSCAVIAAAAMGELWMQKRALFTILSVVLALTLVGMDYRYYGEALESSSALDCRSDLLAYLSKRASTSEIYVPYILVPTLHFYHPTLKVVGYDNEPAAILAQRLKGPSPAELLCVQPVCDQIGRELAGERVRMHAVTRPGGRVLDGPVYSFAAPGSSSGPEPVSKEGQDRL